MSGAVRFRPEAQAEALDTRVWYENRQAGLGEAFTIELEAIVRRISENPQQFRRVRGEIRRAVLNRFPYAAYFRVDEHKSLFLRFTAGSIAWRAQIPELRDQLLEA